MSDPIVEALRRLVDREGGHIVVADAIGANDQSIYQILAGVKLPSGKPKGVGPSLRFRLSAKYPHWLNPKPSDDRSAPTPPSTQMDLADALERLGIALAEIPEALREAVACNLAGWARDGGADHWRQLVATVLAAPAPSKRTGT